MHESSPRLSNPYTVLQELPGIFWTVDTEMRITFLSGRLFLALGLRPEQCAGQTLADFYHTTDPKFVGIIAHRQALAGEHAEYLRERAGISFHCCVEPIRDEQGRIYGAAGLAVDITRSPALAKQTGARMRAIEPCKRET